MTKPVEPSAPRRIQRKRSKNWTMPENTVYVGRPSKWGNEFRVTARQTLQRVLTNYRQCANSRRNEIRAELRGKNLACWCPLDQPCHADILLEIANAK